MVSPIYLGVGVSVSVRAAVGSGGGGGSSSGGVGTKSCTESRTGAGGIGCKLPEGRTGAQEIQV